MTEILLQPLNRPTPFRELPRTPERMPAASLTESPEMFMSLQHCMLRFLLPQTLLASTTVMSPWPLPWPLSLPWS